MKKVVYTCLTGHYDELKQPLAIRPDWDYICFSDCIPEGKNGAWQIRRIPIKAKDAVLASRYAKLMPHKVLPEFDWSLYIDANLQIVSDGLYDILDRHISSGESICQVKHWGRDCAYDEIVECYRLGYFSFCKALRFKKSLQREGFPRNYGLFENNIILRHHNEKSIIAADEMWWKLFSSGQKRDQLSINYVYWKLGLKPKLLFDEGVNARNCNHINYYHHPSRPQVQTWFKRKWDGTLKAIDTAVRQHLQKYLQYK